MLRAGKLLRYWACIQVHKHNSENCSFIFQTYELCFKLVWKDEIKMQKDLQDQSLGFK